MVLWFMRRNYLNDPTLFLHFCDYPPFKEDLDHHLNTLNNSHQFIMQDLFEQSLNAIGLLVLEKIFSPNINISDYGFRYCGPSRPPGTMISRNLNLHYIRN
jgi:hypothetical protein